MKSGKIIQQFSAKDGEEVILRTPKWEDLDDLLFYVNSLVDEQAEVARTTKMTRSGEADWLGRHLGAVENDRKLAIVAEVDSRMVGQLEVQPKRGHFSHVGEIMLGLLSSYRDLGIGTEMMKEAEKHLKAIGVEVLYLEVFASNSRARHIYNKLGYRETGKIPGGAKLNDEYIDMIMMVKTP